MWIYFSCENVFGLFCYRQWYKVVLMFKLEAMSGYPLFNFLPARLPPTSLLQMQTFTVSINSLWNILRGISEMRTSTGSVWVTPRRESIYLAVCCSKFNKGKKRDYYFCVSSSKAFLGVHQTSMQQMCYLFQGKLIHFPLKLCRMRF